MQPGILFIALIAALQIQHGARLTHAAISGYLDFDNLPETNFSCEGKVIGGYYADVETACQMFHVCTIGQKGEVTDIKFLCLNGTVFDQETRVCERIDEVDCSQAEEFYGLNLELYGANAFIAGRNVPEDLEDAANSGEVETSTPPNTTPPSSTTTTTVATTTTTKAPSTTPPPPPPQLPTPKPSPPKFVPPTPRPHPHHQQQYGTTSPGTLSLLAFAHNQNHEELRNVVPHQHQQIYHNSQRPPVQPSQPTRAPFFPTTRRPPHNFSLKPLVTSSRPPVQQQQQQQQKVHSSHFSVTTRPTQISQNPPHRHQQPPNPTLQSFKQFQQEQKAQQDLQRQKEQQQQRQQQIQQQQRQQQQQQQQQQIQQQQQLQQQQQQQQRQPPEQFSSQHHYFGNGYHHSHNFQHHSQLPESSPSSILSVSPSPSPSHLLSPPPPPTSPSPSQTPYHHNPQFHSLLLNGLSLDQGHGQQPSASPSPSPNPPHQSPFFGGHHLSTPVPSIREGKGLEPEDEETAAHEQHQQQIQQQQIQQQQQQHEQHQQRIQQHQQKVQAEQQKQQAQQQQQIQRQQQQQEHHVHQQHFPPPPTVAVVSSSSSTSTSHSSVAIVTGGGFNNLGTSSTTTQTPPPVTSTSISISGPSGGGHPVIEINHPHEPSAPSAEGGGEHFDDEYSDSDYALDSFFEDVPKLRSVGGSDDRSRRRKRSGSEEPGVVDVPSNPSAQEGFEARRRGGRGRLRQTSITLQVSPQAVSVAEEVPTRNSDAVRSHPSRTRASSPEVITSIGQRSRSQQRSNFGQVRASFRAQPISVVEDSPKARGRQAESRRLTRLRNRPSPEEVESTYQGENVSIPLNATTTPVPSTTTQLPETSFSCEGKVPGGLYADPETDCQLFHICSQGRHGRLIDNKFLCGPETRFNQQSRTCQTKELVDCASAPSFYFLNTHFQPPVIEVRPELQFEAQKVHVKRDVSSFRGVNFGHVKQKNQKRDTSPASFQGYFSRLQHCFDEKHCGNKWEIYSDPDYHQGMRRKRDSNNPIFDRRRPRFGLIARPATTEKPKDREPATPRQPNRSSTSSKFRSTRREDSGVSTEVQNKVKSAPRSFVPSQSKYGRSGRFEPTTESAQRRSATSSTQSRPKFGRSRVTSSQGSTTTSKPKFGRGRAIATTTTTTTTTSRPRFGRGRSFSPLKSVTTTVRPVFSRSRGVSTPQTTTVRPKFDRSKIFKATNENRGVIGNVKEKDGKLPVTFRQHNILNQIKTTTPAEEIAGTTEVLQTDQNKTEEVKSDDKKEVDTSGSSDDSEEEYVEEDEEESDENYVEGDDETSEKGDSKPISSVDKNKAVALKISEDSSGEKGLKILNIFPVTSQGTVFKAEIGGKEYRFNGKDWIKVDKDDSKDTEEDDELYSEEYIDEEEDDSESNKNSQEKENVRRGKSLASNQKNPLEQDDSQKDNNVKVIGSNTKNAADEVYEDDSYEDDWDSEDVDSDLDSEKLDENDDNKLRNNGYFVGSKVANNDMTELSPTGTTLNVKPDNEFELSETDEDDFEETNRAVRKTSLGRRKIQALGNGGKIREESRKVITEGYQPESLVNQINETRKSLAEDDDYEYSKDEDDAYEEEESTDSKLGNENVHGVAGWNGKKSSSSYGGSKSNGESIAAYEDDEYVDEYEETPNTGKSGFPRNVNQEDTLNRGSLLHLPIPSWKNINASGKKSNQQVQPFGTSWDSDEENYTLDQDEEYSSEGGELFQDEDEQYDDQEEGHDHEAKGNEEFYPDEEEVVANRRGVLKFKQILGHGTTSLQSDDPDYVDNEEDSGKGKGSKRIELRYDEYEANNEEDDNVTEGKYDSRGNSRSYQDKGKNSKQTPLPYLRLVNPENLEEEYTTIVPLTPNLFRTVKPRRLSWKQVSAPELPPVILPRRTTAAPVEITTAPATGYRKGKPRGYFQGGFTTQGNSRGDSDQPVTQSTRRWQPKQVVSQSDETPITKDFTPSRGTYRSRARGEEDKDRTTNNSPRVPRLRSPKPTIPTKPAIAVSPTKAAVGYRANKSQLRTNTRKRVSDIVQFSESQVSRSRENFPIPYPDSEKDIVSSYPSDKGQIKLDDNKNRIYNRYQSDDRSDVISRPTLPPVTDENSTDSPSASIGENTYFPLPITTSTPTTTPEAFFCNDLEMFRFHADPSNPRLFHYCSPGFTRGQILDFRYSCIKGMSFSEENQRCV